MTVRITRGQSDVIFDVSDDSIRMTLISDGNSETFVYDDFDRSDTVLHELKWLATDQPGVFRLFWLTLAPWSTVNELFVHYAKMYNVALQ